MNAPRVITARPSPAPRARQSIQATLWGQSRDASNRAIVSSRSRAARVSAITKAVSIGRRRKRAERITR